MYETITQTSTNSMQSIAERLQAINREMAIIDYESDKAAWIEEGRAAGRAERHTKTVINTLNRYTRRKIPISADILADIAEDNEMTVKNVRDIAKDNGITLSC